MSGCGAGWGKLGDPGLVVIPQQVLSDSASLLSALSQQLVGTTSLECHPFAPRCHVRLSLPCSAQ